MKLEKKIIFRRKNSKMVSVAPSGILAMVLLFVCTCTYCFRVPKIRPLLFQSKTGFLGLAYKCAVIGTRLDRQVAVASALCSILVLFA